MTHIHTSRRRLVICALPLLIGVGCATAPPAETHAVASPTPAPGSGRIVFFRTSSIFGYAMRSDILLDQKVVGRSAPATKFSVDVTPGVHHVSIPNSLYSGDRTLDVPVKAGEIVYVRSWAGSGSFAGRTEVELVNRTEGESESAKVDAAIVR